MTLFIAGVVFLSYLIGSIPFGYLLGLTRGVDIRKVGSGNIGATNVFRTLGRGLGITTFILDLLKGLIAVCVIPALFIHCFQMQSPAPFNPQLFAALAVLLGHAFPFTLGFKGGKGVATGAGIAIGLAPQAAGLGFAIWILSFLLTRYVSVASILAALTVGSSVWFFRNPSASLYLVPGILSLIACLIILKHRSNIQRLLQGTENRFCFTEKQRQQRDESKRRQHENLRNR